MTGFALMEAYSRQEAAIKHASLEHGLFLLKASYHGHGWKKAATDTNAFLDRPLLAKIWLWSSAATPQ